MAFVLFAALIFLTWGEIFTLFPSTCTDTFGPIRDCEFEPALHGEGDFGVRGSDRKPCEDIDRQLAHGVCGHRPDEFHRGGACLVCAQAAAAADARRALNFGKGAPG